MMDLLTARELLAGRAVALPPAELPLPDALGCRLAEAPRADSDLPAGDVSVMDGYAARAQDLAGAAPLPVAFTVAAGRPPAALPAGAAARIFTGARLPDGADVVVPQEQAQVGPDGRVRLAALERGRFVRRRAEVCARGAALAQAGELVTPGLVGLLAAARCGPLRVIPRPRLALVSTGSELVAADQRPGPGQVRDSNGLMLAALARRAGLAAVFSARVADERGLLREALREAAGAAELVLTCGGVSVGDYDLVPAALSDLRAELLFHRLSLRPGKPLLAARLEGTWLLGLPGNPLSALVGWRLFARPLAEALAGDARALGESPVAGVLVDPARNRTGRTVLAPARLQTGAGAARVSILPWKGSHDLAALARAEALALLEVGAQLAAGDPVGYFPLE